DPVKRQYMGYFKLGPGPLYMFYRPFHLPHLELPLSVARAVLFRDATITPRGAPVCEAETIAKRDLKKSETLDVIEVFMAYGAVESYETSAAQGLLPITLSVGCTLLRDVAKDQAIGYDDVALPPGRYCDRLRAEQAERFAVSPASRAAAAS